MMSHIRICYHFRDITKLGDETQLKIGVLELPSNLDHNQSSMMYTDVGCLYLHIVYEDNQFYARIGEDLGAAYDFVPKLYTGYSLSHEADGTGGQSTISQVDVNRFKVRF